MIESYDPNIRPEMQEHAIYAAEQVHSDWLDGKKTAQNYQDIKEFCTYKRWNYDAFLTVMGTYLRVLFEKEPKFRDQGLEQQTDTAIVKTISDISMRQQLNRIYKLS